MQTDGNLVVYHGRTPAWSSKTSSHPGSKAVLQSDGNFVVYSNTGSPLWNSRTTGKGPGTHLVMQADGNAVLYKGSTAIWDSHTVG